MFRCNRKAQNLCKKMLFNKYKDNLHVLYILCIEQNLIQFNFCNGTTRAYFSFCNIT